MKNLAKIILVLAAISFHIAQAQWYEIETFEGQEDGSRAGWSVSVNSDGSVVAFGEVLNSNSGTDAGQIKVYEKINNSWTQIGQAIPGVQDGEHAGDAISLNAEGNIVAFGAPFNEENGVNAGQVRVFENNNGNWVQMGQSINGQSAFNESGRAVSLNAAGTILAIGSHYNSTNGNQAGHVRVFEYSNGSWVQLGQDINGVSQFDEAGWSVSLNNDGTIVAIGAKYYDGDGYNKGHVRVYELQNGSWVQLGGSIDGEADSDLFGFSVSLNSDGSILASGGISNEENGSSAGHVRVFEFNNGTWNQMGGDIDGETGDNFGYSVSISNDGLTVVSGGLNGDGVEAGSGIARVYTLNNGTWVQVGETLEGEVNLEYFGRSVSMNSDASTVVVGVPQGGTNFSLVGKVKVYSTEPLGVSDNIFNEVVVYPNPTNNLFTIKSNALISSYSIYDMAGKLVLQNQVLEGSSLLQIAISNLENGIYIIKLKGDKEVFETKISKQ